VTRPRPLPDAIVAAWLPPTAVYALYLSTVMLPLLLFPTGRPLAPRWRPVLWITGAEIVGLTVLAGTQPEFLLGARLLGHGPQRVQDGDLGVEDLAAVVVGRAHPVDLLLRRRNDLVIAQQRENPSSIVSSSGTP
jgi:hypothetical protein